MDIMKLSTDWAKAEVLSAKIVGLVGLALILVALGFWQMGKTPMAKAFVWPLLIASLVLLAVSAGLYLANKPRIAQFAAACTANPDAFIKIEIARTAKSQHDLALVFKILPVVIIVAALMVMFSQASLWRAIGVTSIVLMTLLMVVDSNTDARNTAYHQSLMSENP